MQMSLGQQQPVVPGVLDQSPASLPDPLLQARQGPGVNSLRQHQTAPQIAQVVGQQAQRLQNPEPNEEGRHSV